MKDFLTNLGSIYWWLSVVLVGIVINLFSAYLRDNFDDYIGRVSDIWRNRSEKRKAARQEKLSSLIGKPHEQTMVSLNAIHDMIRSAIFYILGSAAFIAVIIDEDSITLDKLNNRISFLLGAMGTVVYFMGMKFFLAALSKKNLLQDARKKEREDADKSIS